MGRKIWTHKKIKGRFRGTMQVVNVSKVRRSNAVTEIVFILVPMDELFALVSMGKKGNSAYQKKCYSFNSWQQCIKQGWMRE